MQSADCLSLSLPHSAGQKRLRTDDLAPSFDPMIQGVPDGTAEWAGIHKLEFKNAKKTGLGEKALVF